MYLFFIMSTLGSDINVNKPNKNQTVISINVDYKQILNNEGAFSNLINNNHGTRIIVNVIFQNNQMLQKILKS